MSGHTPEVMELSGISERIWYLIQSVDNVAYEQHTGNLIALLASEGAWRQLGSDHQGFLKAQIAERLGLPELPPDTNPWANESGAKS